MTEVSVHPLVILNVSDQINRSKCINSKNIVGIIIGNQLGRSVDIINSFELRLLDDGSIDDEYLTGRLELYNQVFPQFELLGFYTNIAESEHLQEQLFKYRESPLMLYYDESITESLPFKIYELIKSYEKIFTNNLNLTIKSSEVEMISISHSNKYTNNQLKDSIDGDFNSISLLHSRLSVIVNYLNNLGDSQPDPEINAMLNSLYHLLNTDSHQYKDEFNTEFNDTQLTTLLSSLTTSTNSLNSLLNKFQVINNSFDLLAQQQ